MCTLRNVSVGDNCLIEKTGNYINNYTIGNDCYIANISQMETTEGATFGEGNLIAVLNEVGDGNVILFHDLNSQFAAFMVKHFRDKALKDRREKLQNLQEAGKDPFQITKYNVTHHSSDVKELYNAHEAEILGDRKAPDVARKRTGWT